MVDDNNRRNLISLKFLKLTTHISRGEQCEYLFPCFSISADHILAAPAEVSSVGDTVGRREEPAFAIHLRGYERLLMQSETVSFQKLSSMNDNKDKMWVKKGIYLWTTCAIKRQRDLLSVICRELKHSLNSWLPGHVLPLITESGWRIEECFPCNSVIL